MSHTPNGFDPAWVYAINGVLADREVGIQITDIDHALWDEFIGPLVDRIEDAAVEHDLTSLDVGGTRVALTPTVDLNKPVMLWRCRVCGHIRTVIGSCHQHNNEAQPTDGVWYVPADSIATAPGSSATSARSASK